MQQAALQNSSVPTEKRNCVMLLVEDNPGDVVMMREALRENGLYVDLRVARHGEEAMAQLKDDSQALPDLILLDLNLPNMNGLEVLAALKSDPRLQLIPVLILTTSLARKDVESCYRLHANSYLTKPLDFGRFVEMVRAMHDFWLALSVPPIRMSD